MIKTDRFQFFRVFVLLICSLSFATGQAAKPETDTSSVFTDLGLALKTPESVYKLKLKKKKYKLLPKEIFTAFPNLRYLDISHNQLTEIPAEAGNLTNLEYLNISHNKLAGLPAETGNLKRLKKLILNNNEIVSLPAQIGELTKLEYLDLWSNELGYIPDEIGKLESLKTLDLRGILIDEVQQKKLKTLLPSAKIHFSPGCNCGN